MDTLHGDQSQIYRVFQTDETNFNPHFFRRPQKCRELNNLHTTMFIVSALMSTPVTRLHKTWKVRG